jgi:hypothetical protein
MIVNTWAEYDKQQVGTPYWDNITNPANEFRDKLVRLLTNYPIECVSGKEFIMRPEDTIHLLTELEALGIAAYGATVWCFIPNGESKDGCCPDGMGGPTTENGWFTEYVHLGFSISNFFDKTGYEIDLANKCNPHVRDYIQFQLPKVPGFNEHIRVSPDLYVPLMWDLFSGSSPKEKP